MSTETEHRDEVFSQDKVSVIDLRSDTVTRPTKAMRLAMASAEVGDDVYGEDPTVNMLEASAAEVFGREAALFVPTGTMGNQIAIRLHTQPGQEVICESRAHIVDWEMAMAAAFSGCQLRPVVANRGIVTWKHIESMLKRGSVNNAATGLISLENSHNMAGGTVTPLEVFGEIWNGARELGIPLHLDGARIFNAAVALNLSVAVLTSGFNTVMFCLSKGLCAPVGSMLVGNRKLIARARMVRKALGGGMRQAGVLAAAGLIALEEMPKRLAEDHANARLVAGQLAGLPQIELDMATVQTNIVIFALKKEVDAETLVMRLRHRGILCSTVGQNSVRFVTHHDVDRAACEQAGRVAVEEISKL
jgi:threonine aldolase